MSIALLALAAVGVVGILLVVGLASGGGRGIGAWLAGALALLLAGAAAVFFLRGPSAPPPPPAPVAAPAPSAPSGPDEEPAPGAGDTADAAAVAGRVVADDEDAAPLAGATVELFRVDTGAAPPFGKPEASAVTAADGLFRFEARDDAASWMVRASAPGRASASADAAPGEELELRLAAGRSVAGTVKDARSGAALAGARIQHGNATGAVTGPDGAFVLEGCPAEPFAASASHEGYATGTEMAPEEPGVPFVFELEPATGLLGTVFGTDGAPFAGAEVRVEVLRKVPMLDTTIPERSDTATSGGDGSWSLTGLPSGRRFRASASSDRALADPVEGDLPAASEPATRVDLHLRPAAALLVTVRDEAGAPVAGAAVTVRPADAEEDPESAEAGGGGFRMSLRSAGAPGAHPATETDAEGVARVAPVKAGAVRVAVSKQDCVDGSAEVAAPAGVETPVEIVLAAGAAITGRVVDEGGKPVAGASVTAQRFRPGAMTHESRESDAEGAFRIGGLEGGGYMLSASKAGHVDASLQNVGTSAPVTVTLARGGAIAGTARDADGNPVLEFTVKPERTDKPPPAMRGFRFDPSAMAGESFDDAEGRWRVDGLEPGVYTVTGRAAGLAPARATEIKVVAGETTPVDLVLPKGLTLRGVVVRRNGEAPVAGAKVRQQGGGLLGGMDFEMDMDLGEGPGADAAAAGIAEALGGGRAAATTDASGRFELTGLEPGSLDLSVKAKGLSPEVVRGVTIPASGELRVALGEGAAIEGVVYGPDGAPKAGAMVMLQKLPTFLRMVATGDDGRYRAEGLPPGSYMFMVMDAAGMARGDGFSMKSESVRLEDGKTTTKDWRPDEGVRVVGRVTRGGKPAPGATVMLMPAGASAAPVAAGGFAMGTSKPDGAYEIAGVRPGRYTVAVQADAGGMGGAGGQEPLDVPEGVREVRRDFDLPSGSLRGIVVDSEGAPVSMAQVQARIPGKETSRVADIGEAMAAFGGQAITDDAGRFAMEGVPPGTYTLSASASGHGTALVEGVVAGTGDVEVKIVLAQGVEVTVRVTGPDGKPVAGAGIYCADPSGRDLTAMEGLDAVRTGADGRAVVRCPPGTVRFEALASGFAPGATTAAVPESREVAVALVRGGTIRVVVEDGRGPVAGATVTLLDAAGNPHARRISMENLADLLAGNATGADGATEFRDLPAGSFGARAQIGERSVTAAPAALGAGEAKTLTLRLE